ncbi:MAG: hypothetical protein DHS20C11_35340 [Lysobacteraceae bacterium]|nr:MAG: hypothetical protein DHS20C11_35340 [Xanthomonadaceae bacterium]
MSRPKPPRISQFVWSLILPCSIRDSLLGDIEEEFARIADSQSAVRARRWYVKELLRSAWAVLSWRFVTSLVTRALLAAATGFAAIYLFEFIAFDWVFGDALRGTASVYGDVSKVVAFGSSELFISGLVAGSAATLLSRTDGSQLWVMSALTLAGFLIGYSIYHAFAMPELMSVKLRLSLMMLKVPFVLLGAWAGASMFSRCFAPAR